MTMIYDEEIFQKYRALAITDINDLVIGERYYTNDGYDFTLLELISDKELYRRENFDDWFDRSDYLNWIVPDKGYPFSLKDHNVGASYNPWLVFDTKETCDQCKEELKIEFPFRYDRVLDEYDYEWYYEG